MFLDFYYLNASVFACQIQMFLNKLSVPNGSICGKLISYRAIEYVPFNHLSVETSCYKSTFLSSAVKHIRINNT